MADNTAIEWCDATWQPITGCSVVSPGCTNCYAMRLAGTRLQHHWSRKGLTRDTRAGPVWTGEVRFNEEWLDQPLKWRRPRRIFVCAHGDLFAEAVPDEWIDRVFAVMALAPQHTFLVLTKRAERMRDYLADASTRTRIEKAAWRIRNPGYGPAYDHGRLYVFVPLPNVWLGVSVEDQARADERIPLLLATPAAKRFLSCEPLLGPVRLRNLYPISDDDDPNPIIDTPALDWVIAGGESGPGARPMHPDWARSLRDQCAAAGVAFFFKQWGEWGWAPDNLNFEQALRWNATQVRGGSPYEFHSSGHTAFKLGKAAAGRRLDGRAHDEFPA